MELFHLNLNQDDLASEAEVEMWVATHSTVQRVSDGKRYTDPIGLET